MKRRQVVYFALVCAAAALAAAFGARPGASAGGARRAAAQQSFVLTDFGATGDGVTDDGPALQAALDALADAGGGSLHVPAGRYAILTPVAKTFPDPTISITISGVPSDVPAPPHTAGGEELTRGLGLTSEFLPRTGEAAAAVYVEGLRSLVIEELAFVGTPDVWDDAAFTLYLSDVGQATVRHSEFYGLASMQGAVIIARRSALGVERSVFLGCVTSSGVYASVIQNSEWKSVSVADTAFTDYGQRPDLYGKLGMAAPWSWVNLGAPAPPTADSPRREAVFRNVFFDEGGLTGISSMPRDPAVSRPIDLLHVSGLRMNVSNLRTSGLYLEGLRGALVEDAFFGWSSLTDTAVNLLGAGSAVVSRLDCDVAVTTVRADSATDRLAAIDVRCPEVASLAPSTRVFNAATPDDDPTLYVRSRFQTALGRAPDPAAHFYWADRILRCDADAACSASARAALAAYLASGPQPTFALEGRATDEAGGALAGVAVTLSGSQTAATVTDAEGRYRFQSLPTSGVYTVSAAKTDYTFAAASQTVTTPAGARVVDFPGALDRHTLSGLVVDSAGRGVQGVTVTLSGGRAATTTTDAGGAFVFASLPAGADYTLTPSSARYSFAPASQSFTALDADRAAVFPATPLFHSITAQVFTVNNAPVPGARVTLTGAKSAEGVTDSKGLISFGDLPRGGSYTLAPAPLVGYTFPSGPQTFNNLTTEQGYSFFAAPTAYKIRGRVTAGGAALAGVTMTLSGSASAATTTDANGAYAFDVPASGDFTVAPSHRHYTFAPASTALGGVTGDRTADFAATLNRHRIAGRVTKAGGQALAGVTVTLSGAHSATATTDAAGNYSFANLAAGGDYAVTPARAGYDFAPKTKALAALGADQTADFTAAALDYAVAGRVTAGGAALAGVTVTLSGSRSATATTDANGAYSFSVSSEGSYTVTPSRKNYTFAPPSVSFADPVADRTADFAATLNRHAVAGRVARADGRAMAGVTVTLSGAQTATATTDANGDYSFAGLPAGGAYTVTPSRAGYDFAPASRSFADLGADQSAPFVVSPATYAVAGRVTAAGAALAGVTMTLSGSRSATATTDANGAYSFNVTSEGAYTVTPSKTNYTFAPAGATFNDPVGAKTADFAATLNRHRIAGRVTKAGGQALAGVTVTLSGAHSATATTDAAGGYSFANLAAGGDYTVTPARAGYDFAPKNKALAALGADQTADFTAAALDYAVAGRVTAGGAALAGVTVTLSGSRSATATTDANGAYSFSVSSEGSYTVTPSRKNYTFAPPSVSFADPVADRTADFAATLNRHAVAGRVTNPNNYGLGGVTVTLSGAQAATATTDANGDYSFTGLPAGGDYTVTPSLPTLVFTPAARAFNDLGADARADFVGAFATYRLSGRVTENGAGLSGVSVGLAGLHPSLGRVDGHFVTSADGAYAFDVPAAGDYTVTPSKKNYVFAPAAAAFKGLTAGASADFAASPLPTFEFAAASYEVHEDGGSVVVTVRRVGDTAPEATVVYQAVGDTARRGSDFLASIGRLTFAPGETSKTFEVFITDDAFVEGFERFTLTLEPGEGAGSGVAAAALVTIDDNDAAPASVNPVDADEFFIRQHYRDFFSREPDAEGLAFWTGELAKCGADAACREARRVSVSAAFFLSIEFQETGYLVYRLYRAAYERAPDRVEEFMLDARVMGEGVVVGRGGWEQRLRENRAAFVRAFVERPRFAALYPASLTPEQFVDALFGGAGVAPSAIERQAAVDDFGGAPTSADPESRALALRRVAEQEAFKQQESNRAFVLMQYFGYLRRDPDEAPDANLDGYNFWLSKLNEFAGDYERAEMVKAFISSAEYRGRFGN